MPLPTLHRRALIEIDEELEDLPPSIVDDVVKLLRPTTAPWLQRIADAIGIANDRIAIYDGDLRTDSLDTLDERLSILVVHGDLVIDGCFGDSDHPEMFTHVTGSMRARDVITSGWLEVCGNLTVERALLGDGNDCAAWIGGEVACQLFYPERHPFRVGGGVTAPFAFGDAGLLSTPDAKREPAFDRGMKILEVLDPAMFRIYDDSAELRDYALLKRKVRRGEPLR